MPYLDVFEQSDLNLTLKRKKPNWATKIAEKVGGAPKVVYKFAVTDAAAIADKPGEVDGELVKCTLHLENVPDDKENYTVSYKAIVDKKDEYQGADTIRVWPKPVKIILEQTEGSGKKPAAAVPVRITHDSKDLDVMTDKDGIYQFQRTKPGTAAVTVMPPWELDGDWTKGTATTMRERKATVRNNFTVEILTPAGDATKVEQMVNLDSGTEGADGKGHLITFTVGDKDDSTRSEAYKTSATDEYVYIKCTFSCKSKRCTKDPKPELKDALEITKTTDLKTQKGKVKLDANRKATFKVELGKAGGETCKVEVGSTAACGDDSRQFENWRHLWYEIVAPAAMTLTAKTVPVAGTNRNVKDFVDGVVSRVKTCLDPCFLKFTILNSHIFEEPAAPAGSILTKGYFNEAPADEKVYVLTDYTFTLYPAPIVKGNNRVIYLKPCQKNYYNEVGATLQYPVATTKEYTWTVPGRFLEISANGAGAGRKALVSVKWTADVDPVAKPTHPGVKDAAARTGNLDLATDVEFLKINKIKFKLPDGTDADPGPGKLVGASLTADKCKIKLEVKLELVQSGLGLAGQGAQSGELLLVYLPDSPNCSADTLIHELGHVIGMVVYRGYYKPPAGLSYPKKTTQDDADTGKKGNAYDNSKGDSGSHCAYGLSDDEKALGSYEALDSGTCIMFGHGPSNDPSKATANLCPECTQHAIARDLEVILGKDWNA